MKKGNIFHLISERKKSGLKSLAVLIDPDKATVEHLDALLEVASHVQIDYFFIGGSLITSSNMTQLLTYLKSKTDIPLVLFPGSVSHLHEEADAVLYLSLVSGRNPDFLIGQHILAAPRLRDSTLEILSTAYLLIDGGVPTTVSYISNTTSIPSNKPEIAASTAYAAELMGMQLIYLDSGSGALLEVSQSMIVRVKAWTQSPLIVGGGIDTKEKAHQAWNAGADIVVIGNAAEQNPSFLLSIFAE